MSNAELAVWLTNRVDALWRAAGSLRTAVAWDNVAFSPPQGPWIRVSLEGGFSDLVEFGSQVKERNSGIVIVEVFTRPDVGTVENTVLCDYAAAMFRGVHEQGLHFAPPYVSRVGMMDGWFKQNVIAPFMRDTLYS
jgi:hypothetical protein